MLSEFATRLIFQFAVRGKTWAGQKVMNSPIDPLSGLVDEESDFTPIVCVYSDDTEYKGDGQDLSGIGAKCGLTISIYVPPFAKFTMGEQSIELDGRGPMAMFAIDMIAFQCRQALLALDNPWGRLWSRFVPKGSTITMSPPFLEGGDRGARVPARAMVIEFTPIPDPIGGKPLTETWHALYDLMKTEPTLVTMAEMMKLAIETPTTVPDWAHVMMTLGLSDMAAENTGLRPLIPDDDDPTLTDAQTYDPSSP